MSKTEVEKSFDYLVSKIIWPHFKSRGYKKSANNFRFYDESGWGKIVNFQKSIYYNKSQIKFTINTGLYLSEAEQFHCNRQSGAKFQESMCVVRNRIGHLSDDKTDLWFDLDTETDKPNLNATIEKYVIDFIIPYLDSIKSRRDILKFFEDGHKSHYPAAQIQTLFVNGFKELAKEQLQNELKNTKNQYFIETLKKIEQTFKE